jgi:2,4-dichlorophenol 6-monooxygenase
MHATDKELRGENVFCENLAGEELGRMKSWGMSPESQAEHLISSPTRINGLPQIFRGPLSF